MFGAAKATTSLTREHSRNMMTPTILLRSGWQDVNIGDISHTPGVVQLIRRYLPDIQILLWHNAMSDRSERMLRAHLSGVEWVDGQDERQLRAAIDRADLLLHGSGPSLVAQRQIEQWWLPHTDKPFGALGVTIESPSEQTVAVLNRAAFVFTRDTDSLVHMKRAGCTCPHQAFAPDGVFAMDMRDEVAADRLCDRLSLEEGRFICVIPRLRTTPYYRIRPTGDSPKRIAEIDRLNATHMEADARRLHEPIIRWVRQTGGKVLACPEMTYQVDLLKPMVIDPLPEDVKANVVATPEYWMPDEAHAIYRRAACVMSMECHSPIMALAVGTPAFYLRQPQDTIKGQMYHDLGLDDWVFEIEQSSPDEVAERLMWVNANVTASAAYRNAAMAKVAQTHEQAMRIIGGVLSV